MIKAKLTEQQRIERFTVPCKGCENRVSTSLKKPYCSHECRKKHKPIKAIQIDCACTACGARIVRTEYRRESSYCCGVDCQRVWAGMCGKGVGVDWLARSNKAKDAYRKQSTKQRKKTSNAYLWWRKCKHGFNNQEELELWDKKCVTAAGQLQMRLVLSNSGLKRKLGMSFDDICNNGVKNSRYGKLDEWEKKCYSACKNMKWKRRLRNAKRNFSTRTEEAEQPLVQRTLLDVLTIQQDHN